MVAYIVPHTGPTGNRNQALAGMILLLATITLITDFTWLLLDGQFFMLQLPILLGCVVLVMTFGLGYILSPPAWLSIGLFGLVYFAQDFTLRTTQTSGGDIQSVIKGGLAFALMAVCIVQGLPKVFKHPALAAWFAYAAFAAASAGYSSTVMLAVGSGIALLALAFISAKVATADQATDLQACWTALYVASVVAALASLTVLAISPISAKDLSDPGSFRLRGITGSANSLGPMMAMGFLIGLGMVSRATIKWRQAMHAFFSALLFATLVLTNSRSSIIGGVLAVVVVTVLLNGQGIWVILMALLAGSLGLVMMLEPQLVQALVQAAAKLISRSGQTSEITSFTGRSDIWAASWKLIQAKPLFGYGMGSIRAELPKAYADVWGNTYTTAHNFILESLISVGITGTALLLGVLVSMTVGLIKLVPRFSKRDTRSDTTWVGINALRCAVFLWTYSSMEKSFAGTLQPTTMTFGLCVASFVFLALQDRMRAPSSTALRASA